jgi:putative ATP-binding cassette transporter
VTLRGARADQGLTRKFLSVTAGYWTGEERWQAGGLLAAMFGLGSLQVALAVRLNLWSADLFDAIEHRSADKFSNQVMIFCLLVVGVMLVNMLHLRSKRALQIGWREWLTHKVLNDWMSEARHYRISLLPGDHDNPDGRIAEDIRIATEAAIDLAHSAFYCLILFASFAAILWSLSGVITVDTAGIQITVHGHLVWLALLYAAAGSALAFLVGGRLVSAANSRQTAEANFRFALMEARENSEAIALVRREARERTGLLSLFGGIRHFWQEQTVGLQRLILFSSAYSVLATMFPILVSSPRYLAGTITLGALMQTGQAFQQITAALSWPVDNFPRIAEWRASVERVIALEAAVHVEQTESASQAARISVTQISGPGLAIRDLSIATPSTGVIASDISFGIQPGEKVLIAGDGEVGRMLFRSVTGIWLWGSGSIDLPDNAEITFVPRHPYFPAESLRSLLAYPKPAAEVQISDCRMALSKVGLSRISHRLDDVAQWSKLLSPADQQRLACASLHLNRPRWVFMDHALEQLDEADERSLLKGLFEDLPDSTFLVINQRHDLDQLFTRRISLERKQGTLIDAKEDRIGSEFYQGRLGWFQNILARLREGLP